MDTYRPYVRSGAWFVDGPNVLATFTGSGEQQEVAARLVAAALNADPAWRVEFVEFELCGHNGQCKSIDPRSVRGVSDASEDSSYISYHNVEDDGNCDLVLGGRSEVLAKMRGEPGKGGADGET